VACAVFRFAAVVHPRSPNLDRARAQGHLAGARLAIAHDLGTPVLVSLLVPGNVVGHLRFEGLGQHPPGSIAGDLIEVGAEVLGL
jgi:hypothetical protein